MEGAKSNSLMLVGMGFVVGVIVGGLILPEVRGYSSRAECLTKEVQPNSTTLDVAAALGYCDGLFPSQVPRQETGGPPEPVAAPATEGMAPAADAASPAPVAK